MVLFHWRRDAFIGLLGAALFSALAAQASSQLAADKGCYACHGAYRRADAPAFDSLSRRLGRLKGNPAAEKDFVEKYNQGEFLEHIEAHERISRESASLLIHWLVEGAK
ncbi:MAG: hypothetical protein PHS32_03835 [Rhodoferax sp.]|uniref:hypothetical protein n=1 Tax=Rhodoferax sp. TaxID=50421 RepID=UPI00261F6997|nr:hypothetical protein [Rhodoferax sp.]MDD5332855.1 hypothetical protein [Rhodoferax sp.]